MSGNYTHCLAEYEQFVFAYVNGLSDLSLEEVEEIIWEAYAQDDISAEEHDQLYNKLHV